MTERYTLITNLSYVTIQSVRTWTHALLVESRRRFLSVGDDVEHVLRGFVSSGAMPTFDARIPEHAFELFDASSPNMAMLDSDGSASPLCTGAIMRIAGFPDVELIAGVNSKVGLDVLRFPDGTGILDVWPVLEQKVAHHWTSPAMPISCYQPTDLMRRILGER